MNYLPVLKWGLILLLPLTLGWKVAADQKPAYTSKDVVVEFLSRHKFDVEVTERMILTDLPLIHATAGECRMHIAEASPDGWNREVLRELAGAKDQLFIVYRGKIHDPQSTLLTVTHYWWIRYLRKLGLAGDEMPLIAVAAPVSCMARQLPWAELENPVLPPGRANRPT